MLKLVKTVKLTGNQHQRLTGAFLDAFPTKEKLEHLLKYYLNKSLDVITKEGSLEDRVFEVIKFAEAEGWLGSLINAAKEENYNSPFLKNLNKQPSKKVTIRIFARQYLNLAWILLGVLIVFTLWVIWMVSQKMIAPTSIINSSINLNDSNNNSDDGNTIVSLSVIVDSSNSIADATREFTKALESQEALERIENNIEKEELGYILRRLIDIEYGQTPLLRSLRIYAKSEGTWGWSGIIDEIYLNIPIINDLVDVLETFNGDLIFRDLGTYKQLQFMTKDRVKLYEQLKSMGPPTSQYEKEQFSKIVDNLESLITQSKIIQIRLSEYVNSESLGDSVLNYYPMYPHYSLEWAIRAAEGRPVRW